MLPLTMALLHKLECIRHLLGAHLRLNYAQKHQHYLKLNSRRSCHATEQFRALQLQELYPMRLLVNMQVQLKLWSQQFP
uniref:Putative secreted protein n=1 Tax=Panstrongylus lignarius TaxID=156445 RepID=A0A224Y5B4_9HEMI